MVFMIFLVENLVDKYGKGENFVKKCQTCDYEQIIHTSGVHTSVDGLLWFTVKKINFLVQTATLKLVWKLAVSHVHVTIYINQSL